MKLNKYKLNQTNLKCQKHSCIETLHDFIKTKMRKQICLLKILKMLKKCLQLYSCGHISYVWIKQEIKS